MTDTYKIKKANYIKLYNTGVHNNEYTLLLGYTDAPTVAYVMNYKHSARKHKMLYKYFIEDKVYINSIVKSGILEHPIDEFKYLDGIKKFCYFALPHVRLRGDVDKYMKDGVSIIAYILYSGKITNYDIDRLNEMFVKLRDYCIDGGQ